MVGWPSWCNCPHFAGSVLVIRDALCTSCARGTSWGCLRTVTCGQEEMGTKWLGTTGSTALSNSCHRTQHVIIFNSPFVAVWLNFLQTKMVLTLWRLLWMCNIPLHYLHISFPCTGFCISNVCLVTFFMLWFAVRLLKVWLASVSLKAASYFMPYTLLVS